jgi:hypothetical protein
MTDPVTLQNILEIFIALILALIAYYNQQRTKLTASVADATAKTATTNAMMAMCQPGSPAAATTPAAAAVPASTMAVTTAGPTCTKKLPDSRIYDPALNGGIGPNNITWDRMQQMVRFTVSAETKKNMLSGVEDPIDRSKILAEIDKAEQTNEYHYTIGYAHGYYVMQAVCDPVGTNQYAYQVVVNSSGMMKQDK